MESHSEQETKTEVKQMPLKYLRLSSYQWKKSVSVKVEVNIAGLDTDKNTNRIAQLDQVGIKNIYFHRSSQ